MRIINRAPKSATLKAGVTTAQIFADYLTATKPAILYIPGSGRTDGKLIEVRASGYVVTNADTNITATLYKGTSLTVASNTILKASTARALNSAKAPFSIVAKLLYDSVSGFLHGTVSFLVSNTYDAPAVVTNVVTTLDNTEPVTSLCAGLTFSAADAGSYAELTEVGLGF